MQSYTRYNSENSLLKLSDAQYALHERLLKMLDPNFQNAHAVWLTSPFGTGKTYQTMALADALDYDVVVIGPASAKETWVQAAKASGDKGRLNQFISFLEVRRRPSKVAQQQTTRNRRTKEAFKPWVKNDYGKCFDLTPEGIQLFQENNVMLVIDEVHNLRNDTMTTSAVLAFTDYLHETMASQPTRNLKIVFQTASVDIRTQNALTYLKLSGLIVRMAKATKIDWKGVSNVGRKLLAIDNIVAPEISSAKVRERTVSVNRHLVALFKNQVLPVLDACLEPVKFDNVTDLDVNVQLTMTPEEVNTYKIKVRDVEALSSYKGIVPLDGYMRYVESLIIPAIIVRARKVLDEHPTSRVVVYTIYKESLCQVVKALCDYQVAIFSGHLQGAARELLITEFQKPTNTFRVVGCTYSVACEAISLHDVNGNQPRWLFTTPHVVQLKHQQCKGRVVRHGLASDVHIETLYPVPKDYEGVTLMQALKNLISDRTRASLGADTSVITWAVQSVDYVFVPVDLVLPEASQAVALFAHHVKETAPKPKTLKRPLITQEEDEQEDEEELVLRLGDDCIEDDEEEPTEESF